MSEVQCQCGGDLKIDFEETKKHNHAVLYGQAIVYCCQGCGNLHVLSCIGKKPIGYRTKKLLQDRKEQKDIPF